MSRRPRRITYNESSTTGALVLERPDFRFPGNTQKKARKLHGVCNVLDIAWGDSAWFQKATRDLDTTAEHETMVSLRKRVGEAMQRASEATRRYFGWLAIRPEFTDSTTEGVIGFALAKKDVSGSATERIYKQVRHPHSKVYACVSDINVLPADQGRGIGAALLDASLQCFNKEQPSTVYVAADNPIRERFSQIGYQETGSQMRTDLLGPDAPIEEVRLQAASVGDVLNLLHEQYPWLNDSATCEVAY